MTLHHRAVEEMYSKGWQGSRAAYLSMIAVMGKRHDYDGVLYVSLHYASAFGQKIVDHCCHELQMTSQPFLASFRPPLNLTPGLYIGCFNKHNHPEFSFSWTNTTSCFGFLVGVRGKLIRLCILCSTIFDDSPTNHILTPSRILFSKGIGCAARGRSARSPPA